MLSSLRSYCVYTSLSDYVLRFRSPPAPLKKGVNILDTPKDSLPSPLAPLPQERGTRERISSPSPAGEGVGG